MEMKKSSRRAGIAIVLAGLTVGLMPSAANAADSGWRSYFMGTQVFNVGSVSVSRPGDISSRVETASEGAPVSGSIGLRVHYGSLYTTTLWSDYAAKWTTPYDISQYFVNH